MVLGYLVGFVVLLLLYLYYALTKNRNYWADRGIPSTGFKFLFGDEKFVIDKSESIHGWALRHYKASYGKPLVGMWGMLGEPILLINKDFDLIRSIYIKDFDHFAIANNNVKTHKDIWPASKNEKIMLNNVQSAWGDEWKDIR